MNPEDHREILRTRWPGDIHFLPWVGWLGAGDVLLHDKFGLCGDCGLGLCQHQRERREKQHGENGSELFHGLQEVDALLSLRNRPFHRERDVHDFQ